MSVALPRPADRGLGEQLLAYSRAGIEKDRVIWENLSTTAPPRLTPRDYAAERFRAYADAFGAEEQP